MICEYSICSHDLFVCDLCLQYEYEYEHREAPFSALPRPADGAHRVEFETLDCRDACVPACVRPSLVARAEFPLPPLTRGCIRLIVLWTFSASSLFAASIPPSLVGSIEHVDEETVHIARKYGRGWPFFSTRQIQRNLLDTVGPSPTLCSSSSCPASASIYLCLSRVPWVDS